jgi:hypothetical protein
MSVIAMKMDMSAIVTKMDMSAIVMKSMNVIVMSVKKINLGVI